MTARTLDEVPVPHRPGAGGDDLIMPSTNAPDLLALPDAPAIPGLRFRRPWRRRGLGRSMTAASLRRLRVAGMSEALLGVDAKNPTGALGLYEGLGFSVHQRSSVYRRPARD